MKTIDRASLIKRIKQLPQEDLTDVALAMFSFQYINNPLYQQYCQLIGKTPDGIAKLTDIPFLPIRFFKTKLVSSQKGTPEQIFESSTTTGQNPSRHAVWNTEFYHEIAWRGFTHCMGEEPGNFCWFALLPGYLERESASLVHMVGHFIKNGRTGGGFYLQDIAGMIAGMNTAAEEGKRVLLIGVTHALLKLAGNVSDPICAEWVFETGGMKGTGTDLTRTVLHRLLREKLGTRNIGSEYGMTELLSQAWSLNNGVFMPAPTMRVMTRELTDPLHVLDTPSRGALNIIDLANIDSCAFIATDDVGTLMEGGRFTVDGRLDGSEQRGCNLMVSHG